MTGTILAKLEENLLAICYICQNNTSDHFVTQDYEIVFLFLRNNPIRINRCVFIGIKNFCLMFCLFQRLDDQVGLYSI